MAEYRQTARYNNAGRGFCRGAIGDCGERAHAPRFLPLCRLFAYRFSRNVSEVNSIGD